MLYGGVQKNLGPAGATFIIMKKSMLERQNSNLTAYMDYSLHTRRRGCTTLHRFSPSGR
jgi:phosphoserine aminotransferase